MIKLIKIIKLIELIKLIKWIKLNKLIKLIKPINWLDQTTGHFQGTYEASFQYAKKRVTWKSSGKVFYDLLKSLALAQSPKSKSKGEALGQGISLHLVYPPHTTHTPPHTNF